MDNNINDTNNYPDPLGAETTTSAGGEAHVSRRSVNLLTVLCAVCAILLIFALMRIGSLSSQIRQLENDMNNNYSFINNSISSISSSVSYQLEQEASIINGSGYDLGAVNPDDLTIPVHVWASVKEYSPVSTKAELQVGGDAFPMTLNGGKYEADIVISVKSSDSVTLLLTDGENVRSQPLSLWYDLRNECVPSINAYLSGSYGPENKIDDTYVMQYDGSVDCYIYSAGATQMVENIKSADIIAAVGGREYSRTAVDISNLNSYSDTYVEIADSVPVSAGESFELYLEAKLDNGLTVRKYLLAFSDGTSYESDTESIPEGGDCTEIYGEYWRDSEYVFSSSGEYIMSVTA